MNNFINIIIFLKKNIYLIGRLIAIVISIVALSVSCSTLNEMKKERHEMYSPCVVFDTLQYAIQTKYSNYHDVSEENLVNINIGEDNLELPYIDNSVIFREGKKIPQLKLSLLNIGAGVAKNIKITCSSDDSRAAIDEFLSKAKWCHISFEEDTEFGSGYHISFFNTPSDVSVSVLDNNYISNKIVHSFVRLTDEQTIKFLNNSQGDAGSKNHYEYFLPNSYYVLALAMHMEYMKSDYDIYEEEPVNLHSEFPDLPIQIEYTDIQGVEYKKDAVIKTELSIFARDFIYTVSIKEI